MSRRWRHLKLPRGQYWRGFESSPAPPAWVAPQTRPAGPRRLIRPPRGQFWHGFESSPVPPAYPPQWLHQAGSQRFQRPRRPCRFDPPWAPPSTVAPPQLLRPAGPRRLVRPPRGQWHDPGWGQANQGTAHQQWLRQAGPSPRYGARLNRSQGRRFDLPYPASVAVIVPVAPPTGGGKSMLSRYMRWADL